MVVMWRKRIWRCVDPDCDVATWTEQADAIAAWASMTMRARAEACRQVGEQNRSVACVARDYGVGWSTVMAAVEDHGAPLVDEPGRTARTAALGLDEVAFLRANARRHTTFATNFVDLVRGRLLDRPGIVGDSAAWRLTRFWVSCSTGRLLSRISSPLLADNTRSPPRAPVASFDAPRSGGLGGASREPLLVLGRRNMAEGTVETAGVPPGHPLGGGPLEVGDGAPRMSPPDQLGLVQPVDRLGQGVVVAVAPRAHGGHVFGPRRSV